MVDNKPLKEKHHIRLDLFTVWWGERGNVQYPPEGRYDAIKTSAIHIFHYKTRSCTKCTDEDM